MHLRGNISVVDMEINKATILKFCIACFRVLWCCDRGPEPVSYTHLDVYKRQLHRWCNSCELVSPANVERDRCFKRERWSDSERYIERNREVEIFKISRDYEEFMERLGGEMIHNRNKNLPCNSE